MQIYIMRHGEAQHITGLASVDDSQRLLTDQGQLEAQMMGKWLATMATKLDNIFVSPYVRAQQTCQKVIKTIGSSAEADAATVLASPVTLDFITPSGDAKQVHDFIDGMVSELEGENKDPAILFVSHMPLVSYLVAELTNSANAPIFATAAIAEIEYDVEKMQGELVRLVSPLDLC